MNFFEKLWSKIKEPKGLGLAIFYILFAVIVVGTILVTVFYRQQTVFHYILYCLSAFSCVYIIYNMVIFAPKIKNNFISFLKKHKVTNALLENYGYRTLVLSIFSFIINIAFVLFMGITAILNNSAWFYSIAVYYLILSLMKGNIFYSKKKYDTTIKKAKTYRFCGIMFLLLTIALSGIVILIYTSNMAFEYAGLLIYAVAAFTFYKFTISIINLIKARKQDDLYVQSIRNINFVSALVSILVLQVAMFQEFAPELNNLSVANALTGAGIAVVILALGVMMIIKGNKVLKQGEREINEE